MWATSTVGRHGELFADQVIWCVALSLFRVDSDLGIIKNEYSRQIKELRAQEKPGKTHGKVFVKGKHIVHYPIVFYC